jgi:dihydrodipicolinate synthase/N-acetylneuraminate lyase
MKWNKGEGADMARIDLIARIATTFGADGEFDEEAMALWIQRFVDADMTVYVASSGSGEGASLTMDELARLYRTAVSVCAGKVELGANLPDQATAKATLAHAELARSCKVDTIQLYGPARAHGYMADEREYRAYFDYVLSRLDYPVTVSPNPIVGFSPGPRLLAEICNAYPQVVGCGLTGISSDVYVLELLDALDRELKVNISMEGSLNTLALGATGINAELANLLPKTLRRYADLYAEQRFDEIGEVYTQLVRALEFTGRWKTTSPRVHKMTMRAFKLPGWEGGVRAPFVMLDDHEQEKFTTGLLELGIPEIDDLALAAGLVAA